MIKYKHKIDRRLFLKGSGVSLALPFLDAMVPSSAVASSPDGPALVILYLPNGGYTRPAQWVPSASGRQFQLPELLMPLSPNREYVSVVTGLHSQGGEFENDGAGDHARSSAPYLTGVRVNKTTGLTGKSIDQMIADALPGQTKRKSIELGMQDEHFQDSGYPQLAKFLSWSGASTPRQPIIKLQQAFDALFGAEGQSSNDSQGLLQSKLRRESILDLVSGDISKVLNKLCVSDKEKMDQYLTAVRDLEKRIGQADQSTLACTTKPNFQPPAETSYANTVKAFMDLIALAFECNATRVVTFSFGQEVSGFDFNKELGVNGRWHNLSHHPAGGQKAEQDYMKIVHWMSQHCNYLLTALRSKVGADGKNLLDRSLVTYGPGFSNADTHSHKDIPLVLAGRGGGFVPGSHIPFSNRPEISDLWLTIAQLMGCSEITKLGIYGKTPLKLV